MAALAGLDVLVLDCQATGASPTYGHVLELGWAIVRADDDEPPRAEAHWIALPEGHRVPTLVRRLTGYEPRAAAGALADSEAWRRLRAATAAGPTPFPTAIHFARFELSFLREWAARLEPAAPFPFEAVCVHDIANRLLPDLPRLSLRALAGHLGHGLHLERRSLGHVDATAFVWRRLCERLAARGIGTWEDLRSWLAERAPVRRRPDKPRYPIERERYRSLPDAPGVYRFLRSNGDVLYVGKAASLRKRTASHFVGRGGNLLGPEMLTQVSDIAVTIAASALEAALLENETIKRLQPPYNMQLTASDARVWYGGRDFDAAAPAPSEVFFRGPVPSEYALRPLGALAVLLAGPAADEATRAHAVGMSALWPPDEAVFAAGWRALLARYGVATAIDEEPRARALQLAQRFLDTVAAAEGDDRDDSAAEDDGWDPERVARHIERASAQAFRAHRRARWLRLIHDCDIVYREPATEAPTRALAIRGGAVAAAGAADELGVAPPSPVAPGPLAFDRVRYDRLRILTTELKRVLRDGGSVSVRLGAVGGARRKTLGAERLRGIFKVV